LVRGGGRRCLLWLFGLRCGRVGRRLIVVGRGAARAAAVGFAFFARLFLLCAWRGKILRVAGTLLVVGPLARPGRRIGAGCNLGINRGRVVGDRRARLKQSVVDVLILFVVLLDFLVGDGPRGAGLVFDRGIVERQILQVHLARLAKSGFELAVAGALLLVLML